MSTPESNIIVPVAVIPTPAEIEALVAEIARLNAQRAELVAQRAELVAAEEKRKEEMSYKALIAAAEPRFSQTKNILVLRRCPNPDELAPARTVFDHIEVQDLKREAKDGLKRITVSEKELMAYQAMKAEEIKDITYKMIEDRLKKSGHNVVDTPAAEVVPDVKANE